MCAFQRSGNVFLVLILLIWVGCGKKDETKSAQSGSKSSSPKVEKKSDEGLWVVMQNKTGDHMHDFRLDYGTGTIAYQIFSKDYTFSKTFEVVKASPLKLSYSKTGGEKVV